MLSRDFTELLRNPPKEYRPIPFWSWNERLRVAETRRQIGEMDRAGIGGYFMHARGGLQTEYMGEEWMANIEAGIEEARQRGMGAWAYDENGWPSGFGNGRVNGKGLKYQQKYLRWEELAAGAPVSGERTITVVELDDGRRLRFYFDVNPFYVDTLDREVIADFLNEIYAPYAARFGGDFGRAMPGFFTDEPQVSRNGIPWSFRLEPAYRAEYGEELLPLLPCLFFEYGPWRRTRYRFWRLVRELFVTAFSEQIYNWCESHGCRLTGHMVLEETLLSQITSNAAVMPHYEYFHVPGMDWLGRHIDPPTTPLQVASVAHQLGKPQVLSETFALTGWNVSFGELKWMFEWQMVRGATLLCQHLEGYSLRGIRKRDYPPSLFFQQPWWGRYRLFNDAVSRVGMLLSRAEARFDVLVLHPQSSAWIEFDNRSNAGIGERFETFLELTRILEAAHVPFDYGDERILERHGAVEANGKLQVGRCRYGLVIVPPVLTLAASTVRLLEDFAARGGVIFWYKGAPPEWIDGDADPRSAGLARIGRRLDTPEAVAAALPAGVRRIRVTAAGDAAFGTGGAAEAAEIADIAVTERWFSDRDGGAPARLVYCVNSNPDRAHSAVVRVPGRSACRLALETGETAPAAWAAESEDRLRLDWRFEPAGSLLLLVSDDPGAFPAAAPERVLPAARRPLPLNDSDGDWELELLDPNALTLDYCDVEFDGERVLDHEHISVVQKRALDLERPVDITLRFRVRAAADWTPPPDCALVVERPDRCRITVNGAPLGMHDKGAYWDTSFRRIDLEGTLHGGENEIVVRTRFRQPDEVYAALRRARVFEAEKNKLCYDSEIEAVYLVGSFGVRTPGRFEELPRNAYRYSGPFLLDSLPTRVRAADLTRQGLPFFAGRVRLRKKLMLGPGEAAGRCFEFEHLDGHVLALRVNGRPAAEWLWRPFRAELDGFLVPGENEIELELTGGLRNLLGPHHLKEGESYAVGPGSFFKEPNIWGAAPWDDRYCFVRFGVRGLGGPG